MLISISKIDNIITFTTENISRNFPFHKGTIIDIAASNNLDKYCILYSSTYISAQTTLLSSNN